MNYRITELLRLAGTSGCIWSQHSQSQKGHPVQVVQDNVNEIFEDSQGGDSTASLSNLRQCCHLHSTEVLLDVQRESAFQFMSTASCPIIGHHQKEPESKLFAFSIQVFIYIDKIPPEPLHQAEQSKLSVFLS